MGSSKSKVKDELQLSTLYTGTKLSDLPDVVLAQIADYTEYNDVFVMLGGSIARNYYNYATRCTDTQVREYMFLMKNLRYLNLFMRRPTDISRLPKNLLSFVLTVDNRLFLSTVYIMSKSINISTLPASLTKLDIPIKLVYDAPLPPGLTDILLADRQHITFINTGDNVVQLNSVRAKEVINNDSKKIIIKRLISDSIPNIPLDKLESLTIPNYYSITSSQFNKFLGTSLTELSYKGGAYEHMPKSITKLTIQDVCNPESLHQGLISLTISNSILDPLFATKLPSSVKHLDVTYRVDLGIKIVIPKFDRLSVRNVNLVSGNWIHDIGECDELSVFAGRYKRYDAFDTYLREYGHRLKKLVITGEFGVELFRSLPANLTEINIFSKTSTTQFAQLPRSLKKLTIGIVYVKQNDDENFSKLPSTLEEIAISVQVNLAQRDADIDIQEVFRRLIHTHFRYLEYFKIGCRYTVNRSPWSMKTITGWAPDDVRDDTSIILR